MLPSLGTLLQGVEIHDPPFSNSAGRSDIRGCCWWGRGVLQVQGVCSYGKLNHWLGAKAAKEGRSALYPDIDFCKNPGAICSDTRAGELRWVTGMFQWVHTMQQHEDYFPTLQKFMDSGNYKNDKSFIGLINRLLLGTQDDIAKRTNRFHDALRAFNLIPVETTSTKLPIGDGLGNRYCGLDFDDAGSKCEPCDTNFDCRGATLCYAEVEGCYSDVIPTPGPSTDTALPYGTDSLDKNTNAPADYGSAASDIEGEATDVQSDVTDTPIAMVAGAATTHTTNYCGKSWEDAAASCAKTCEWIILLF